VLPLCYEEKPGIYLEQNPENNKTPDIQNVKNKSNLNLKFTLLVLAHKN